MFEFNKALLHQSESQLRVARKVSAYNNAFNGLINSHPCLSLSSILF